MAKDIHSEKESYDVKVGLAEMLKGGVIMDVTSSDQAKIAEEAGAVAVMVLDRAEGGVARMACPELIQKIQEAISIPVMAKCRIGHFVEAQILESLFVDFIDESEVLMPADEENNIDKHAFKIPFVCGSRDLGEALRRIGEGASLIRTRGEAGSGNIVEAVRHMRTIMREIRRLVNMEASELMAEAKRMEAPFHLVQMVAKEGKLPVPIFAAGGIATPADAALMMQLGAESLFAGSGIFTAKEPLRHAKAIVGAVTYFNNPEILSKLSMGLLDAMKGMDTIQMRDEEQIAQRGW